MKAYILALDQGTTSSRSMLFDESGEIIGQAQQEFNQIYPQPGWVEHDPEAIWASQLYTMRAVLNQVELKPEQVAAVGLTNQRETTIVWDRETGVPIYNAIVWQCRRTAPICERLKAAGLDRSIQEKTGLLLDAYFSGTKLMWLLENVPDARGLAEQGKLAFGTVDTFLLWRLSGGKIHVTDASNASRTLLFNIHTHTWDEEILEQFGIPPEILPDVCPSSAVYGMLDPELLGAGIPLAGIAGDQQAALFGQACYERGMAKNTYGTGCFLLLNTGDQAVTSKSGLLTTIGWELDSHSRPTYALEGSVFIAGAAVQWLRDELGLFAHSHEIENLASTVEDNGGVYIVPAFVGLGAPYWDPYARGTILGLTRGSKAAHIARATLESIAYQTRDVLEAMQADSGIHLTALRVDGGAARNDLLMQFQADILGVPVQRPAIVETTALGAAFLAGLAVGVWPSTEMLADLWRTERVFVPCMSDDQRNILYYDWKRAVERSQGWARSE